MSFLNLKYQEKLSNIDLKDYLESRKSPLMPLSYYVRLSLIYFDFSASGCSFRCFRGCKYDSGNSQQGIISTHSDIWLSDIPLKVIKENVEIISYLLYHDIINLLSCAIFPTSMKYADFIPIHKKDDKTDKENYRLVSILPNVSKVYHKLM